MGKSKGSQSSELDPAIRQMMQETFDLGKGAITETYDTGRKNQWGLPIMGERLKEYQPYEDDRFVTPDSATTIGENRLENYLLGNDTQEARLNDLYSQMLTSSGYTPDTVSNLPVGIGPMARPRDVNTRDVTSRDVAAGTIDLPSEIARTNVASRDVVGERVADPNDITAREVLERGFDIERISQPGLLDPVTLADTSLDPYMNPYNQYVRNVTINDILEGRERSLSQLQDRAIKAGAFGGSREGVEAGLIQSKALSEIAKQSALLGQQGFNTASQLATQDLGLLNQAQRDNITNQMEAQRLNQATDLAAEQSMLDAAMEAQRLNQARDLSLGQFNTEMMQQAALANQANKREIDLANATRDLQAQGMNQEDAFRVAQSNVDNKYRAQAQNVANTLEADLSNQASSLQAAGMNQSADLQAALANQSTDLSRYSADQSNLLESRLANQQSALEAAMANQAAGLDANALNQQGLLSAAGLADASNQSTLDRYNQLREIGGVRDARGQQQLDFDYQQFQDAQTYQMMLAQFLGGLLSGFPTPLSSRGKQTDTRIFM